MWNKKNGRSVDRSDGRSEQHNRDKREKKKKTERKKERKTRLFILNRSSSQLISFNAYAQTHEYLR